MPKKETSIKKQAEKKAVDEALITAVLSRVAEIGVRKAAEEAGVAWQTVSKWKKDAELTTAKDIKEDVEEKTAKVIVPDDKLSLAIGKEGLNARLAAKITGFKIDIKSETQAKQAEEMSDVENIDIDDEVNLSED